MYQFCKRLTTLAAVLILSSSVAGTAASKTNSEATEIKGEGPAVLWRNPVDIASRNLYYGPGGKEHAPHGTFTFQREDLSGTTPKFEVVDQDGVKWKVKMGDEARPETAATRLLWAVGYFANEDYFVPVLHVQNIRRLHRVGGHVSRDGSVHNVRMKRHQKQEKNIGDWAWGDNPFTGTREFYGLRVMMAVINNWDLKDENNAVYQVRGDSPEQRYIVRDLGSSFGTTGFNLGGKGNLHAYRNSNWISTISPEFIDFNVPSRPALLRFLNVPETVERMHLCWIGRHIPSSDAAWIGNLLAKLSPAQIRDAFRGAGYSPRQVEGFSLVVERRIGELQGLNKMLSKGNF
jgi:hypothetical protein